jgi:hypothetical protein
VLIPVTSAIEGTREDLRISRFVMARSSPSGMTDFSARFICWMRSRRSWISLPLESRSTTASAVCCAISPEHGAVLREDQMARSPGRIELGREDRFQQIPPRGSRRSW